MYLYICRQSLGMQFSYPKNKSVMNKIRDGLLKESRFNILSKKRDDLFCIVNKYGLLFLFKKSVGKSYNNSNSLDFWIKNYPFSLDFWMKSTINSLDFWMKMAVFSLDFWIKCVSLL